VRIDRAEDFEAAWAQMGRPLGVLEMFVPFTQEISSSAPARSEATLPASARWRTCMPATSST